MRHKLVISLFYAISQCASATEWIIPNPVTYEWTVERTRKVFPKVDFDDTTIGQLIFYIGSSSMNSPLRLEHDLPDDVLNQKLNWHLKDVLWIDLVAKIADIADAEIVIGKRVVTLRCKKPAEPAGAGQAIVESEAEPEGNEITRPDVELIPR